MAPRNTGKEKESAPDEEDVLQAVILADSFNKRFKPLTSNKPRCLIPVCNATLLEWTFESLAMAGVQEIFVICRSHADLVKAAIKESKWSKSSSGLKIVPIVTAKEAFSVGDAMRDVYTHGIITNDFILVMGDLVSNLQIDEVVRLHKERRRTNKDAIMTIVVKEAGAFHRTRPRGDTSIFALDATTSQCLHYEATPGYPPKNVAGIPRNLLMEHPEIELRNDLIDCSIDICSVEVPSLFQDNFDYQDIRRDFVHGVLTSDLLGKSIYCHVVKDGYAARVKDTKSYAAVSKDILSRWTFPLVPDDNHPGGHTYEHRRDNKYIAVGRSGKEDDGVMLSRSCTVGPNTLIGRGASISHHSFVKDSVIGENCTIGVEADIRDSYIWDGAIVEDRCVVEQSIIGSGVCVKSGSKIRRGCLVADGVIMGPNADLKPFTRVSPKLDEELEEGNDSELEDMEIEQTDEMRKELGNESNGIIWPQTVTEEDEDELDPLEIYNNQRLLRMADDAADLELSDMGSITSSESESESEDDDFNSISGLNLKNLGMTSTSSLTSLPSTLGNSMAGDSEFQYEVTQSLDRAFDEGHSVDDAAVELKTLRMASNVPLRRVREAVISTIVDRIPLVSNVAQQRQQITKMVERWGGLITQIGGADGVETLSILQTHCATYPTRMPLFGQLLIAFYQEDIVEEEDIKAWHKSVNKLKPTADSNTMLAENMQKCFSIGAQMIKQLAEQEDDSNSE